ncbi:MAG: hypothetical protein V4536_08825 [Pseudomonadota bacterium]
MTDLDLINVKIRTLIRTIMGMPVNSVRKANTNSPTGGKSEAFATVLIATIDPKGADERRVSNIDGTDTVQSEMIGERILTASVQFFRQGAYQNALRLVSILSLDSSISMMQQLGLGLIKTSSVTNVTAVINTEWEEQAKVSIDFSAIVLEGEVLNTYGTVELNINSDKKDLNGSFIETTSKISLDFQA